MWPVGWFNIKWWILFSTSKGTDYSSRFQVSHTTSTYYQYLVYIDSPPQKPVPESQIRYMCWCKHHACEFLQVSVQDPDCTKLAQSSKFEIDTYTTDRIKVVGFCILYGVNPDTQYLQEVTFHVASHKGTVMFSRATTLALSLKQPCTSLNCLPPSASLISIYADHPMKTKCQMHASIKALSYSVYTQGTIPCSVTLTWLSF